MKFDKKTLIIVISLIFLANAFVVFALDLTGFGENAQSLFNDLTTSNSPLIRLVLMLILSAPILAMVWLGSKEGKSAVTNIAYSAITLLVMFYISYGVKDVRGAAGLAWYVTIGALLVNQARAKEAGTAATSWIIFGAVSMFIAPFASIWISGAEMPFVSPGSDPGVILFSLSQSPVGWIFFGLIAGVFGGAWVKTAGSIAKRAAVAGLSKTGWGRTAANILGWSDKKKEDLEDEIKKLKKEKEESEKQNKTNKEADKDLSTLDRVLKEGKPTEEIVNEFSEKIQTAESKIPKYPATNPAGLQEVTIVLDGNEIKIHKMISNVEGKEHAETKLGNIRNYLFKLYKNYKEEMQKGEWPNFEKLKETKFKAIIDQLKSPELDYLNKYAIELEHKANKITIHDFVVMLEKWILHLNAVKKDAEKRLNKIFKEAEQEGRKVREVIEPAVKIAKEDLEQEKMLKKYDEQARRYYEEMLRLVKEVNRTDLSRDDKQEIIKNLRQKMRWIIQLYDKKPEYLEGFADRLKKIKSKISGVKKRVENATLKLGEAVDTYRKVSYKELKEMQEEGKGYVEKRKEEIKENIPKK